MNLKAILFLLGSINFLYAGFTKDTLINAESYISIQQLSPKDTILSLDLQNNSVDINELIHTFTISTCNYYRINLENDSITCSAHQKFYDPILKKWIRAKELTEQSHFLSPNGVPIPCIQVEKIEQDAPLIMYEISLSTPHTYFVSKSQILTHNVTPVLIGLSWALGEGISLTGIGIGLGRFGLGLWQTFGGKQKQKTTFAQIQKECANNTGGGAPDPDDENKTDNMKQFFQTEFGSKIKNSLEKTNKRHQGQSVYRVTEKIQEYGLKKGDQLYLDNLHKDHLEVFGKNNKIRSVLNLDGTENIIKLIKAAGREL
jgi:hypothetical protein